MKRPFLHIYFWVAYLIYDTLLHFTWMGSSVSNASDSMQLWMGIKTALCLLPIKLFLVYYIILRGAKEVLREDKKSVMSLLELGFVFFLSVVLFRLTNYYLTDPVIYSLHHERPLFNSRSVFIAILEMGLIGGVAFALKLYRMQFIMKEREKNLLQEKLETELKFLRNQTNPHFLFNTLNNIYALARKKSDKTPEVVMKLSELLSFMLYGSGKETITVKEEVKMLEDFIDLQKIRYNDRLSIKITKNIDDGNQRITPLLLMPIVENAFKYGVSETRFNSFIHLDICLEKSKLSFSVENTIEKYEEDCTNGKIGLANLKRQLELIYTEHELKADKKENKYKVHVSINLDSYEKIQLHHRRR